MAKSAKIKNKYSTSLENTRTGDLITLRQVSFQGTVYILLITIEISTVDAGTIIFFEGPPNPQHF